MAYQGNSPAANFQSLPAVQRFNGTGSATAFTLASVIANDQSILVSVDGVTQDSNAYSVSGTTLTFTAAPSSGTGNIFVHTISPVGSTVVPPDGIAINATTGTFSGAVSGTTGTFSGNVTADKYIMVGGSQIGQDYAYLKAASTSEASLTLRKDSTGADSIDYLQMRSDGNGLISKITGAGVGHFTGVAVGGSGTANTLDDYEEGTWTPAFTASGATFGYSVQKGSYVKIGALVTLWYNITLSSISTSANSVFISGLPFSTYSISDLYAGGGLGAYANINLGTGTTLAYQLPAASGTQIELKEIGDNMGENGVVASELTSTTFIRGSIFYRAA